MARIWQNGFEFGGHEYAVVNNGTREMDNFEYCAEYESTNYRSSGIGTANTPRGGLGSKSLRISSNQHNSRWGYCYASIGFQNIEEMYFRTYVALTNMRNVDYSTSYHNLIIARGDVGDIVKIGIRKTIDRNYEIVVRDAKNNQLYVCREFTLDVWVKIDFRLRVSSENDDGIFQLKINDRLVTTYTKKISDASYINEVRLGDGQKSYNAMYFDALYDDVAINDTSGTINNSWCGNGSIVNIHPYANGSVIDYEPLSGENWENVSETTPDSDNTINTSYAIGDTDLFKFKLPDEISDDTVINAIQVVVNARYTEQPMHIDNVVKIGETEIASENALNHAFSNHYMPIDMNPNTSAKFTAKELRDDIEIGYRTKDVPQEDV